MAKIVCGHMPAPRELPQQIPATMQKAMMQKPQSRRKPFEQFPGVTGGKAMAKIDSCIKQMKGNGV